MEIIKTDEYDSVTLARIYKLAFLTLHDPVFRILMTPLQHTHEYLDVSKSISFMNPQEYPTFDWTRLTDELTLFWIRMWDTFGIVPWDFHLFLQPDGRVALTHMENFGFVNWNDSVVHGFVFDKDNAVSSSTEKKKSYWISMPCNILTPTFFHSSTFPFGFYDRVKMIEGVSPVFSAL
jgi:hypothetical protein